MAQASTLADADGRGAVGVNYWSVYEAERFIPSGLVAVLFSLMVFGNAASGAWLFGQPVTCRFPVSPGPASAAWR